MSDRRIVIAWTLLVAATLVSVELFGAAGFGLSARVAGVAVLLIALAKARIVGREFMEIRHGPPAIRLAFDAWLAGLGCILFYLYSLQSP